ARLVVQLAEEDAQARDVFGDFRAAARGESGDCQRMGAGAPEDEGVHRHAGNPEAERQDFDSRFAEEHQADARVAQRADDESGQQLRREHLRPGESSESRADTEDGRGANWNFAAAREGRRRGGISGPSSRRGWQETRHSGKQRSASVAMHTVRYRNKAAVITEKALCAK